MKINKEVINREYLFTLKELKEKLNIKGTPKELILWRGLSPSDKELSKSDENILYMINTVEVIENGK